jgi:hypothetical protein
MVWISLAHDNNSSRSRIFRLLNRNPYKDAVDNTAALARSRKVKRVESRGKTMNPVIFRDPETPKEHVIFSEQKLKMKNVAPTEHPVIHLLDPTQVVITTVWLTEPFGRKVCEEKLTDYQLEKLVAWKDIWTDILHGWLACVKVRACGGFDRYWYPPGTTKTPLRSSKGLFDFLEYCQLQLPIIDFKLHQEKWIEISKKKKRK